MKPIDIAERGMLPDPFIRFGIRRLLNDRLRREGRYDATLRELKRSQTINMMQAGPIAIATDKANEQHYEVPAEFYHYVLGSNLKYSACLWNSDADTLSDAELNMFKLYAERAELKNGQDILELGCGWGSLSLWLAAQYPNSMITAVSNSASQKRHIDREARRRKLLNLVVITDDINDFSTHLRYDRVISVEMLEHVRNYALLFERISRWLKPEGAMFAHIFCHDHLLYPFEVEGTADWMAQHFFTGGMMPSFDTFTEFQQHLCLSQSWRLSGQHYQRTADAWLANMDNNKNEIMTILANCYGQEQASLWYQRWRIFFMACSELFAFNDGKEWILGHYYWRNE